MLKRDRYILIIIIVISISTHWFRFFLKGPFSEGDHAFAHPETLREYFTLAYSWHSIFSMGEPILGNGFFPILAGDGLFACLFNFSTSQSDLIFYFYPFVFFSAVSSYFLLLYITRSSIAGLIGSFVFSYNTYLLTIQTGHMPVAIANTLTPLAILYFIKLLEVLSLKYAIVTSIILAVLSQYEIRIAYIVCWIMIFYLLYDMVVTKKHCLKKIVTTSIIFTILLLTNLYWCIGFFGETSIQNTGILNRGLFGDTYFKLQYAFTIFQHTWTWDASGTSQIQPVPVQFWFVPILAFIPLLSKKIDRKILFFSILALIGIFFCKQSASPFTNAYRWLYYHFPGFNAFREASKFYLITNLSYAVLIGYCVNKLYLFMKESVNVKYVGEILVLFVAFLFLWNTYPLITQKLALTRPQTIPNEYIEFKNHLLEESDFNRTMGIVRRYRYFFGSNNHPGLDASMITTELWQKADLPVYDMINTFRYLHLDWLFDTASIKYVYLPYDSDREMFDYINDSGMLVRGYGGNREDVEKFLDSVDWLTNKKNYGQITVYENKDYLPHIYISQDVGGSQ